MRAGSLVRTAGSWLLAIAISLLVMSFARAVRAAPGVTYGPDCPLPYSPFAHETATPHSSYDDNGTDAADFSFMCSLDQDEDGFDDHVAKPARVETIERILAHDSTQGRTPHENGAAQGELLH